MKRLITPLALAVGIGLFAGAGSAGAAPPTPDTSTDIFDCPGFQVEAQAAGKFKVIDQVLHPSPTSKPLKFYTETAAATTVTLTSLTAAPKTVRYSLNGTRRVAFDLSIIDIVYTATGRNLLVVQKSYGTPGIFLSVGLVTWTLFGPVYPNGGMTGPGTITDVCQVLAP